MKIIPISAIEFKSLNDPTYLNTMTNVFGQKVTFYEDPDHDDDHGDKGRVIATVGNLVVVTDFFTTEDVINADSDYALSLHDGKVYCQFDLPDWVKEKYIYKDAKTGYLVPYVRDLNKDVTTGDLSSKEMGSGARKSSGKPDYSLIYCPHLKPVLLNRDFNLVSIMLDHLGEFQLHARIDDIELAMSSAIHLLKRCTPPGDVDNYYSDLDPVVEVLTAGLDKYVAFNWMKGMPWSVPMGCINRHILKQYSGMGDIYDKESNQPHIAHVVSNMQMLHFYVTHWADGNDLPQSVVNFRK